MSNKESVFCSHSTIKLLKLFLCPTTQVFEEARVDYKSSKAFSTFESVLRIAMSWIEAQERGKAAVDMLLQSYHQAVTLLEVPSGAEFWQAGSDAGRDGYEAIKSISHFVFLVVRPFVLAFGWTLVTVGRFIWERIIVEGLYKHGLSQTREGAVAFWKFQKSLSREELLLEAAICAVLVALYMLRRWLQRNRYIQRAKVAATRQFRKATRVRLVLYRFA